MNIFSLGGLQTIVKRCADDANLSFYDFFPWKLARFLTVKEQLWAPTYYAIKVVVIGVLWESAHVYIHCPVVVDRNR